MKRAKKSTATKPKRRVRTVRVHNTDIEAQQERRQRRSGEGASLRSPGYRRWART